MQIHLHLGVNGSFSGVGPRLLSCSFPLTALALFFFFFFFSLPRLLRVSVRFVHSHATPALLFVVVVLLCCLLLSFLVCKLVDCFISIFLCSVFFFCVCVLLRFHFFFLPHPHSYLFFVIVFTSALHFERLLIPLSDFLCCLSFPPLLFFFFFPRLFPL